MGIAELTQSSGWKKFMAKLYGWGAAVVIIGALFKIMHFPGAGVMLTIGLTIEALIFFFSAFEPLHEELDWTLVYPELAGMTDPDELEGMKEEKKTSHALERFDDLMGGLGTIDPVVVKHLTDSFEKLNLTASSISDVSQAAIATNKYVQNVGAAAESVGGLSASFQQTAVGLQQTASAINNSSAAFTAVNDSSKGYASQMEGMNKNLTALNTVYEMQLRNTNDQLEISKVIYGDMDKMLNDVKTSMENVSQATAVTGKYVHNVGVVAESVGGLTTTFQQTAAGLQQSVSAINNSSAAINAISESSNGYVSQMEGMNKSLAALNAVFEMQLRNTNDQMQKSKVVYSDMDKMMDDVKTSIENVSQATTVTGKYVHNVGVVAESVGGLTASFQQTAEGLQQTISAINNSSASIAAISDSGKGYVTHLEGMNKNLAALNAVYEMQLRSTNDQMQRSKAIYGDMEKLMSDIKMSVEETNRYREEMGNLNRNLVSLNTVYGNMLSAMNVRS